MATERRYAIGKHPAYDQTYDFKKSNSGILRPKNPQNRGSTEAMWICDKEGLETLLYLWEGDENQQCQRQPQDYPTPAKILEKQTQIEYIKNEFKKLIQLAINTGNLPPKRMPDELEKEHQESLAEYDVTVEEINQIKKLLETAKNKGQESSNDTMLKYGTRGNGKGEPLREIDGQKVELLKGLPTIIEPDSPYNKIPVVAYRELIAKPWLLAKKNLFRSKMVEYEELRKTDQTAQPPRIRTIAVHRKNLPVRPSAKEIHDFLIDNGIIEMESEAKK